MLNISSLSTDIQARYKTILKKRKDNSDALNFLESIEQTNNCIFLTGKAGTGKSTLIKDVIDLCRGIDQMPLVLGSTGISALNIWGQTVHSFFSLWIENVYFKDIQHYLNDKKNRQYKLKKKKIQTLMQVPFVIIDEISMLNSSTVDCINFLMQKALENKEPFWGKPVIFVWDIFQLPPVCTQDRKLKFRCHYDSERFFDSFTFQDLQYNIIELKQNYRQKDDAFFWEILDAIRSETISEQHLSILNNQLWELDSDTILLSTHRNKVDQVNNTKISELPWEEYFYQGDTEWTFPEGMKKADNILRLKVWAKVMMITNDILWQWINWSMWTIKDLKEDFIEVQIGTETFTVDQEERANKEITISSKWKIKENILWSFKQFPLKLAYSITVHKSQGMTFDACNLDLCNTFTGGQAYTALSRSKTLSGIKLLNIIERKHLFFHPAIKRFIQNNM